MSAEEEFAKAFAESENADAILIAIGDSKLWRKIIDPEGLLIERKEGLNPREFRKTLCAFANTVAPGEEGVLFVGVANDGKIVGCNETIDDFQKAIEIEAKGCYPRVPYQIDSKTFGTNTVFAVTVSYSPQRPHFTGHAYRRVGAQSREADEQGYNEFIASRSEVGAALIEFIGKPVRVEAFNKKLGKTPFVPTHEWSMCIINEVNPHYVKLLNVQTSTNFTERLAHFAFDFHTDTNAPMFVVTHPGN